MRLLRSILLLFGLSYGLVSSLHAQAATMVRTAHASFMVGAPEGWMLNDQLAQQFNVPVAICAKDQSAWPGVLLYVASVPKGAQVRTLADYLNVYRSQLERPGSKLTAARQNPLKGNLGATAQVYYYTGLATGRSEANAYFENKDSVDMIVLSAPNQETFQKALPVFAEVVGTYGNTPLKATEATPAPAAVPMR